MPNSNNFEYSVSVATLSIAAWFGAIAIDLVADKLNPKSTASIINCINCNEKPIRPKPSAPKTAIKYGHTNSGTK